MSDGGITFLSVSCHRWGERERVFLANPLVFLLTVIAFQLLLFQCPAPFIHLLQGAKPAEQKFYCVRGANSSRCAEEGRRGGFSCPFSAPSHGATSDFSPVGCPDLSAGCCACNKICKEHAWAVKSRVGCMGAVGGAGLPCSINPQLLVCKTSARGIRDRRTDSKILEGWVGARSGSEMEQSRFLR